MALITCKDLSFTYDGTTVLENVNFHVDKGDYLCIVGENGSGKSTLVKGLLKLKTPHSGSIIMDDDFSAAEIGYLPQQTEFQKDFPASVFEVALSGKLNHLKRRPFYSAKEKRDVLDKLELMGLSSLKNACYQDLSGGQQQRVLLARALCATKALLLLDEPTAGLDPLVTNELYALIQKINREYNITVIMVSHDIHAAIKFSNRILHLGQTQLFFGSTGEYLKTNLSKRFLGGDGNA